MGNYRFRLSDMMPNAWFYKLRDMSKPSRNHHSAAAKKKQPPTAAAAKIPTSKPKTPPRPRKSYYFTRDLNLVPNDAVLSAAADLPDPPRKSAKQRTRKRNSPKRVTSSSVSAGCNCRIDSVWTKSDSPPEFTSPEKSSGDENGLPPDNSFDGMVSSCCSSCRSRPNSVSNPADIVIDVDDKSFTTQLISDLRRLPPIITKPAGFDDMVNDVRKTSPPVKVVKEQSIPAIPARKNSAGVKLRSHSPKIGSRKMQAAGRRSASGRRSISESCAVVKASVDPQRDFKESMMEMILENNLRASKDLEDLLACYLSLNSDEYHELIIKVFKQIWFDLSNPNFK